MQTEIFTDMFFELGLFLLHKLIPLLLSELQFRIRFLFRLVHELADNLLLVFHNSGDCLIHVGAVDLMKRSKE